MQLVHTPTLTFGPCMNGTLGTPTFRVNYESVTNIQSQLPTSGSQICESRIVEPSKIMNSSNQAPQVALRCLRRLSRTPITNATISDASTVAELSKSAGKLWTLVADTWISSGTNADVQMLPSGMSCTSRKAAKV